MIRRYLAIGAAVGSIAALSVFGSSRADAADSAGQNISNTATATYSDANAVNYITTSNTLVVTVQNVPSLSVSGMGGGASVPGGSVTDTFTVANTGNGAGYLAFSGGAISGNCSVTSFSYTVIDDTGKTLGSNLALDQMNSFLNGTKNLDGTAISPVKPTTVPAGTQWTVRMIWTAPVGSACSGTYTATLGASITQPDLPAHKDGTTSFPGEDAPAQSTAVLTATTNGHADAIGAEATLDLQQTLTSTSTSITLTTTGNNSGSVPARGLSSAQNMVGASAPGILVVQKVPTFKSVPLAISSTPTFAAGAASGLHVLANSTPTLVYGTSADASQWTTTAPAAGAAFYVGFFIPCGTASAAAGSVNNACLDPNAGTTSAGNVSVAHAEFSIVATYVTPTGTGSAAPNSIANAIANGVAGGNQATEQVLGPGITTATANSHDTDASVKGVESVSLTNVTPVLAPTGASNTISTQSSAVYGILNGPAGNPGALGSEDGNSPASNNGDFTAVVLTIACGSVATPCTSVVDPSFNAKTNAGISTFSGVLTIIPASTVVAVRNTVQNVGTGPDTIKLTGNVSGLNPGASTAWSVAFYAVNTANTSYDPAAPIAQITLAAGQSQDYYAVYSTNAQTSLNAYTPYKATALATSVNDASKSNQTYNEILVNGFIGVMKTLNVDNTAGCSASAAYPGVNFPICTGSKLGYVLTYFNRIPTQGTNGSGNVFPAVATNTSVVIGEDGKAGGLVSNGAGGNSSWLNNWSTYTNLLQTVPTDSNNGVVSVAADKTSFTVAVPAGSIGPGASGQVKYTLVVK